MEVFKEIWENCVVSENARYLNKSAVDFGFSALKNEIGRNPIKAVSRFVYRVITEHPMTDKNKRCAACFLLSSLEYLGFGLNIPAFDLPTLIANSASGDITEKEFLEIMKENTEKVKS
jgi:hypothetical protein